jgi:hypothetical protein
MYVGLLGSVNKLVDEAHNVRKCGVSVSMRHVPSPFNAGVSRDYTDTPLQTGNSDHRGMGD